MLNVISRPLVRLVDRWLPDPYIFVVILTLLVMIAAMAIGRNFTEALQKVGGEALITAAK